MVYLFQDAWREEQLSKNRARSLLVIGGEAMSSVLCAAVTHNQVSLFEQAAGRHKGSLPLKFFDWIRNRLESTHWNEFSSLQQG